MEILHRYSTDTEPRSEASSSAVFSAFAWTASIVPLLFLIIDSGIGGHTQIGFASPRCYSSCDAGHRGGIYSSIGPEEAEFWRRSTPLPLSNYSAPLRLPSTACLLLSHWTDRRWLLQCLERVHGNANRHGHSYKAQSVVLTSPLSRKHSLSRFEYGRPSCQQRLAEMGSLWAFYPLPHARISDYRKDICGSGSNTPSNAGPLLPSPNPLYRHCRPSSPHRRCSGNCAYQQASPCCHTAARCAIRSPNSHCKVPWL